jgi:hypothetical protein
MSKLLQTSIAPTFYRVVCQSHIMLTKHDKGRRILTSHSKSWMFQDDKEVPVDDQVWRHLMRCQDKQIFVMP